MKLLLILSITTSLSFNLYASGTHSSGEMQHDKMRHDKIKHERVENTSYKKNISAKEKKEILEIFRLNEKLHSSFYNYDGAMAEKSANLIVAAILKISAGPIKKIIMKSKLKLESIKSASDRESNNKNYAVFSSSLVDILKMYNIGEGYDEYYCPMEDKQWVQNSKKTGSKVQNPYLAKMKSCGIRRF